MSVRKREWETRKGEAREAWIVDYSVNGSQHIKTFKRKKDADAYQAQVLVDIGKGVHIAASRSATVAEAGMKWLSDADERLEPATSSAMCARSSSRSSGCVMAWNVVASNSGSE